MGCDKRDVTDAEQIADLLRTGRVIQSRSIVIVTSPCAAPGVNTFGYAKNVRATQGSG